MSSEFQHKTILITGAGSGIGQALARQLAREGANLALADINATALQQTADDLKGHEVLTQTLDVSDATAFASFARDAIRQFGQIDAIINNAGIGYVKPAAQTSRADLERVMRINFWGVINGVEAVLPHMLERNDGIIVNISSLYGLIAWPANSAYCASKFAVRGYTEALSQDLSQTGVRALCVHPGGIRTNIVKAAVAAGDTAGDGQRLASTFDQAARTTAEQAARVIVDGMRRNRQRILIGLDARLLATLQRLLPTRYRQLIVALNRRVGIA